MITHSAATPPVGVAALIGTTETTSEFFFVTRAVDVIRTIGSAPDIESARRTAVAAALGFDVVVVALQDELVRLNERSVSLGIETLADIGVPVLMLIGFGLETENDFAHAATWLRKHVRGVLSIDANERELSSALDAVSAGHVVVEPRVSQAMLDSGSRKRPTVAEKSARAPGDAPPLSTREREVLALLAHGLATKNIAHELGISAHTVKAHVESIFAKFGATTRAEAVAIGVRRGAVML